MTQLPATNVEAQALTYARERVASLRDNKLELRMGRISWFDKADSRRLVVQMLKAVALEDSMNMMTVCDCARNGWDVADQALRELIIEFENNRKDKPTALADYTMEITRAGIKPSRRRGPKGSNYILRDVAVSGVVFQVHLKFGLDPYRNEASPRPSACSIVSKAMREEKLKGPRGKPWTEYAVVAIWKKYGRCAQMISIT
jgi:hypothetical protein